MSIEETIKLRSELILSATVNFQPDLFLVDKKPYGLKDELKETLNYLQKALPRTKSLLLLRDILDCPEKTIAEWEKQGYCEAIEKHYHQIMIVGTPEVFDAVIEYKFPHNIAQKVRYCGYIDRQPGLKSRSCIREELEVSPQERLVLVTPGGGEDGYELVDAYLSALALLPSQYQLKSLVICGPEMPAEQKQLVCQAAENNPQVIIGEFIDDLMSYIGAADAVVSMAGYNTICEIVSAGKPAVIIPRYKPSKEQLIRAERMAKMGLFKAINPINFKFEDLLSAILIQLENQQQKPKKRLDMNGLIRITNYILSLIPQPIYECKLNKIYPKFHSVPALIVGY